MALSTLSLAVVGAEYPNKRGPGRRFELNICKPGERVDLRPEPKNPVDPRAVAVFSCRNVQIGYLTAERCGWIGRIIASGRDVRAVFQKQTGFGAWIRVAFDGVEPVLPAEHDSENVDEADPDYRQDFWPDPEWSD